MIEIILLLFISMAFGEQINLCDGRTEEKQYRLILAQIYFRHGRRTPCIEKFLLKKSIWHDWQVEEDLAYTKFNYMLVNVNGSNGRPVPLNDQNYTKMGQLNGGALRGKLTIHGQIDSFELGKMLKHLYIDSSKMGILKFDNDIIRVYSTNYDRTIKSARCVLAAMFPEDSSQAIIYTQSNDKEFNHPNYRFCEKYRDLHNRQVAQTASNMEQVENQKALALKLNMDWETMPSVSHIWDEMSVLLGHYSKIPKLFQDNMNQIEKYTLSHFFYRYLPDEDISIKYGCGLLLNEIFKRMKVATEGSSKIRLFLNSVHDSTIICMLKAFNHSIDEWPTFSSYVSIELLENSLDNTYIRILLNGKAILLDGCSSMITLSDFHKRIEKYMVHSLSFEELCSN